MNLITKNQIQNAFKRGASKIDAVRMTLVDGEVQMLSKGTGGRPWTPIIQILDESPWQKIELLDKRGALLGAPINNDKAAGELEALPTGTVMSTRITEVAQLSHVANAQARHFADLLATSVKPAWDALIQANKDAHELADEWRKQALTAQQRQADDHAKLERARARVAALEEQITSVYEQLTELVEKQQQGAGAAETVQEVAKALPEVGKIVSNLAPLVRGLLGAGKPFAAKAAS